MNRRQSKRAVESAIRTLVVSISTSEKILHSPRAIAQGSSHGQIAKWERLRSGKYLRPAAEVYSGSHHRALMAGVRKVRRALGTGAVSIVFISPVYGVVGEHQLIAPYTESFDKKTDRWIRTRARELNIPSRIRAAIRGWPLVVFLLHLKQLRAIEPPLEPEAGQRLIFLAGEKSSAMLAYGGVTVVSVTPSDSNVYGARGASLKGKLFQLYADTISEQGQRLWKRTLQDDLPTTFMTAVRQAMADDEYRSTRFSASN